MSVFTKDGKVKPAVAGAGATGDPKKPAYRSASGYSVHEEVNSGFPGGKKGKAGEFGGQTSDDMAPRNDLVGQTYEQKDPYAARGADFPVKHVDARTGQSGEHGFSSGHSELVMYSENQCGPRYAEDDGEGEFGSGTPVPGDRASRVASGFPIEINKGESSSETGEIGIAEMVDLQTGYIVGGGSVTRYQEVPEDKLSIGAPPSRNKQSGMKTKDY